MSLMHKEKAKALYEILRLTHAEQYTGTDDNMSDDYTKWVAELSDNEIANIVLEIIYKGI